MKGIRATTPARITLALDVLGKKDDILFHETILHELPEIKDTLTFSHAGHDKVEITSSEPLPAAHNYLIHLLLALLKQEYAVHKGINIHIQKNIPKHAGLYDKESHAIEAVKAANRLWKLNLKKSDLKHMVGKIDKNLPAFFEKGTLYHSAKETVPLKKTQLKHLLLIINNDKSPFEKEQLIQDIEIDKTGKIKAARSIRNIIMNLDRTTMKHIKPFIHNDAEHHIFRSHPHLFRRKMELYDMDAEKALLSGISTTFFAVFKDKESLNRARRHFHEKGVLTIHPT